jgi:hypothetical protein
MNQLTTEQIKTLEDAFASYPEDFKETSKYANMKGIQEQLDELKGEPGLIFYISKANMIDKHHPQFVMEKMVPGVNKSTPNPTTECVAKEPTESQIRKRMELTQESYYTARENLREEAYKTTHTKSPGQSWGDYWKSY